MRPTAPRTRAWRRAPRRRCGLSLAIPHKALQPSQRHRDKDHREKATMAPALRNTGIGLIGEMPWGTHVCLFYETKQDFLETTVPYFKAGLDNREFCVWAISEPVTEAEARSALSKAVPDLDRHLAAGDIEIVSGPEFYLEGGRFDLQRVTAAWNEKLRGALARGYDGMRA